MTENQEKTTEGDACGCGGGSCCSGPGRWIWVVLIVVVVGVLIVKNQAKREPAVFGVKPAAAVSPVVVAAVSVKSTNETAAVTAKAVPRLVDLGATKCIPCRMMAPILEELKTTYAGKLDVVFIDVWEKPDEKAVYGINLIPTQIFYDAAGKELFRHEGFFARDDILAKWKEFGVEP